MAAESLPLTGVTRITENDIICGRGGVALKQPGNLAYRKIVGLNKGIYATCLKAEKLKVSKSIVAAIREIGGRFLEREDGKITSSLDERDENGNPVTWKDIGDKRAIEKTSQALREGQPKLLKKLAAMQEKITQAPILESFQTTQYQQQQPQQMMMRSSWSEQPSLGGTPLAPMPQNMLDPGFTMEETYVPPPNLNNSGNTTYGPPPTLNNSGNISYAPPPQTRPILQPDASLRLSDLSHLSVAGNGLEGAMPGETFGAFPNNSMVDRGATAGAEQWHDSWGDSNPTPLSYNMNPSDNNNFSSADQQQLLDYLQVGNEGGNSGYQGNAVGEGREEKKRPSVKFQNGGRPSIVQAKENFGELTASITSYLDEMSIFDTHSLDSGMDLVDREMDLELLGEFDVTDLSVKTPSLAGSRSSGNGQRRPRRSILKHQSRYNLSANAAAATQCTDPGLIFTSTFDTKPGGINSGTDISGLLGERRKSAVAFEVKVERRRSSRMSIMSMLSRDAGSGYLSIQSADIKELLEMDREMDSDSD